LERGPGLTLFVINFSYRLLRAMQCTGMPRSWEPPPPWDPTVALCLGNQDDPRGGCFSYAGFPSSVPSSQARDAGAMRRGLRHPSMSCSTYARNELNRTLKGGEWSRPSGEIAFNFLFNSLRNPFPMKLARGWCGEVYRPHAWSMCAACFCPCISLSRATIGVPHCIGVLHEVTYPQVWGGGVVQKLT